jgi:hypothetical protein
MTCPLTTAATLLSCAACTPHAVVSTIASSKTSIFLTEILPRAKRGAPVYLSIFSPKQHDMQ